MSEVFLCFSMNDLEVAREIRDELRRLGINVWWDADLPRKQWAREVAAALDRCESMVVLVSPDAMASDLVIRQLEQAIADKRFGNCVFPAFIRPTYAVPWYFRRLQVFDLTKNRPDEIKSFADTIKSSDARRQTA